MAKTKEETLRELKKQVSALRKKKHDLLRELDITESRINTVNHQILILKSV